MSCHHIPTHWLLNQIKVKAYLRRHYQDFQNSQHPEADLTQAAFTAITEDKAGGWFHDSGYV